ncbi:hypothetical protein KsCSTR_08850 [Candidatus Kuenenia stuttgartiensis]|uniref:Uncharacterized protein n=1 Tax=Kuenenia stuttgartiensis TaxID=174633 RepID=A0A6G7GL60_KUEST|nr:hypothetical protein KsCSTR_08850 [Candidatus Kuenenia stuttgartiensis]
MLQNIAIIGVFQKTKVLQSDIINGFSPQVKLTQYVPLPRK